MMNCFYYVVFFCFVVRCDWFWLRSGLRWNCRRSGIGKSRLNFCVVIWLGRCWFCVMMGGF